jgi:NADH-quinone oxidoreductase subunit N
MFSILNYSYNLPELNTKLFPSSYHWNFFVFWEYDYLVEIFYFFFICVIFLVIIFFNKKGNFYRYIASTYQLIFYNFLLNIFLIFYFLIKYFFYTHINKNLKFINFQNLDFDQTYGYFYGCNSPLKIKNSLTAKINTPQDFHEFTMSFVNIRSNISATLTQDTFLSPWIDSFTAFPPRLVFNGLFIIDNFSQVTKILMILFFLVITAIVWFYYAPFTFFHKNISAPITKFNIKNAEFIRYYLFFTYIVLFFLFHLVSSFNLLSLFISVEGITLSLYILAGLKSSNRLSVEAGLKYFLISSIFSCIFGMGLFLLFYVTNSANYYEIREIILLMTNTSDYHTSSLTVLYISIFMIIIVFLMKFGAVPYHFWIGDVYQGSSTFVVIFFATVVRIGFFVAFFRLIYQVFAVATSFNFSTIFYLFGIFSVIYGSFYSLTQYEIKKFLAYSSIVHTGFILLSLSLMNGEGLKIAYYYLIVYLFTLLTFFFIVTVSQYIFQYYNNQNKKFVTLEFKYFSELSSLPFGLKVILALLLFSMAGLPPFPGFIIKLYVLKAVLLNILFNINLYLELGFFGVHNYTMLFLFIFIILVSLLTAYNYIRIVIKMLFVLNDHTLKNNFFLIFNYFNRDRAITKIFYFTLLSILIIIHIILIFYLGYLFNISNVYERNEFFNQVLHPFFFMENLHMLFVYFYDFCRQDNFAYKLLYPTEFRGNDLVFLKAEIIEYYWDYFQSTTFHNYIKNIENKSNIFDFVYSKHNNLSIVDPKYFDDMDIRTRVNELSLWNYMSFKTHLKDIFNMYRIFLEYQIFTKN